MSQAPTYIGIAVVLVSLLICIITTIVSFNCLADKNNQCAQTSGFVALTFCCLLMSVVAVVAFYNFKKQG